MTLREQLASVPRWRVGLYSFVAGLLVAAVAAVVAVGQGLVTPPVEREVETRVVTKVETQWQIKVEFRDRERLRTVTRDVPVVVYVDGGTRVEREVVTVVDYQRDTDGSGDSSGTQSEATDVRQKVTEISKLPAWSVGVLVGGQFAGTPAVKLPNAPGLVVGLEAGYRVPLDRIGVAPRYSLWLEAWGTTSGAAGGGVRGEF